MRRFLLLCVLAAASFAFFSCNSDIEFSADCSFNTSGWHKDSILSFVYENRDTNQQHDLYFYLRHDAQYPHANIYLYVELVSPYNMSVFDTVQFMLASPEGKWYGRGFSHSKQILLPYHTNFRFGILGKYVFRIRHGMRYESLLGIEDFGIQIYKHLEKENGEE